MGLVVLFDELWFPCRSICPQSMRKLGYVRFIDEEFDGLSVDDDFARRVADLSNPRITINDIHPLGFSGFMKKYYGEDSPDNHTHGISFFDHIVGGDPNFLNLIRDLIILEKLEGQFTHVLNGLTRQMVYPPKFDWLRKDAEDNAIRVTDHALTISTIYELTGPEGPYHPVMEELRGHAFVRSFRNWVRREASSLHNREDADVIAELNAVVLEFEKCSLRAAVGKSGLRDVSINLLEGIALDAVPGAATIKTVMEMVKHGQENENRKISCYIAESRGAIWSAHNAAKIHLF